jgi:hypothetical protein
MPTLQDSRERASREIAALPPALRRLEPAGPGEAVAARIAEPLRALAAELDASA